MTPPATNVIGGADTHSSTIHVAAIDEHGRPLGDCEFATTAHGYRDALTFLESFGTVGAVGIEGTSSYGAGFSRVVTAAGIAVHEVNRADRAERRRKGKSDPIDAHQAARAVLSGRAQASPKNEQIDGIRALLNAHRSAVKARTAAMNQIHQMLVTAPDSVRAKYRPMRDKKLIMALSSSRSSVGDTTIRATQAALRMLAKRHQFLTDQADDLERQLRELTHQANPHLLSLRGVGPTTAAQLLVTAGGNPERLRSEASFAALCGTAPVPASSGKTTRHRLSRGGDRAANRALHTIALVRSACDPRTQAYIQRQRALGRAPMETLRLLKRALAREVFKSLTQSLAAPQLDDLRPARQAKNITLTAVANALGTTIDKLSRTERGMWFPRNRGGFLKPHPGWTRWIVLRS